MDFLNACRFDNISVFGWELWIIDHNDSLVFSPTSWTGLIPMLDGAPAVIGGAGDVDETAGQLQTFNPEDAGIEAAWHKHLRVNITIDC